MFERPKTDPDGFPVVSPGLHKLLSEGDNAFSAARLIAINATLRQEAGEVDATFHEATFPLEAGDLFDLLDEQGRSWGVSSPEEMRSVYWNAYYRELQTFPLESVRQAFTAWKAGALNTKTVAWSDIFPRPEQIVTLAKPHRDKLGQMRYRLQKALAQVETAPRQLSDEERTKVAQGFRELVSAFQAKTIPEEMRPTRTPADVARELRMMASEPADKGPVEDVVL